MFQLEEIIFENFQHFLKNDIISVELAKVCTKVSFRVMNDDARSRSVVTSIFPLLMCKNSRSQVSTHTPFLRHNRVLEVACVSRTLRRTTSSSILKLFQPLPLPLEEHVLVDHDHDPSSLPFPFLPSLKH